MALSKVKAAVELMRSRAACFDGATFDAETYEQIMALPPPAHTYAIFFTPRSGSTRLMELIGGAGLSNPPREYFNEIAMPHFARKLGARSLPEYVDLLTRKHQVAGHFGFELTYKHVRYAFATVPRFERMLRPDHALWLIREDIVAQAVSVSRLQQTRVSHSTRSTAEAQAEAEAAFDYQPIQIAKAVRSICLLEERTEAMFRRLALDPLRLSYEQVNAMGPDASVAVLAKGLALDAPVQSLPRTQDKLAGEKARAFAAQFRAAHSDLIARVAARRAPTLERLSRA